MKQPLFIGLLSGTSMDAIDAAIIDFHTTPTPSILKTLKYSIPNEFRLRCLEIAQSNQGSIDDYGYLDAKAGELFASAVLELLNSAGLKAEDILAIGSHGQTIRHRPNATPPFTLQIGDPNIIAERTNITTIADFRRRDIAAGGQGAPLAPLFHAAIFQHATEDRIIINIGGITNVTVLEKNNPEPKLGFDSGPGNCLMDAWCKKNWDIPYDNNGKMAAKGQVNPSLLTICLSDPYFELSPPKSTGREYFNLNWLEEKIKSINMTISPQDILRTLLILTVKTIEHAIQHFSLQNTSLHFPNDLPSIYISGGGAYNALLMTELQNNLKNPVHSIEHLGCSPDWLETILFAWLAKQTLEGKSGNSPCVTGAKRAIPLGGIFGITQRIST